MEITSTLLWEIKQARDVSHENTVRFVGACIDLPRPTVLILTEYCPKGIHKAFFIVFHLQTHFFLLENHLSIICVYKVRYSPVYINKLKFLTLKLKLRAHL